MNNPPTSTSAVTELPRELQGNRPRVWIVYKDTRKDMSAAEKFGQLTDMFNGKVQYHRAVEQARKMLHCYKDGDHIMMVGDPTLCLIVGAVALEFSETGILNVLRWDREEIEYRGLLLDFDVPDHGTHEEREKDLKQARDEQSSGEAEVTRRSRYSSR